MFIIFRYIWKFNIVYCFTAFSIKYEYYSVLFLHFILSFSPALQRGRDFISSSRFKGIGTYYCTEIFGNTFRLNIYVPCSRCEWCLCQGSLQEQRNLYRSSYQLLLYLPTRYCMCTNLPLRYSRCALFCTAHRLHFFMYIFYRFCCFSEVLMSTVPRLCSTFFKSTLSAGNHCTMYKFIRGLSTGDHVFVHCVHCKNVQRWTCSWWFSVLLNILYIATSSLYICSI